jgi:hypothetical protein
MSIQEHARDTGFKETRGALVKYERWEIWVACAGLTLLSSLHGLAADAESAWPLHVIDNGSRGADGVRVADVNRDGLPDLTTGWEEGGKVRVYLHPGPSRVRLPWPSVTAGQVPTPEDAVFADLDQDGSCDVVSCCEGRERSVYVHWAPSAMDRYLESDAWQTAVLPATASSQMWMFALPMQIDGRGGIDLVVGSKGETASISWLQSPRAPRRMDDWRLHRLCDAGWIMSLRAYDMDGDGDHDVLATDRKGGQRSVLWLENPGTEIAAEGRPWNRHQIGASDREFMFLAVGDLNQDHVDEIICAVKDVGITVYWRTAITDPDWRTHAIPLPAGCGTGKGVAVGDIDGDEQLDLVFSCENASGGKSGLRWLSFQRPFSTGEWTGHEISGPRGIKFDRIELLDLDADGDLDVVTCEERENLGVIWYENCLEAHLQAKSLPDSPSGSASRVGG